MLEQFGVSFALVVVDLECLDDEVVGVVFSWNTFTMFS